MADSIMYIRDAKTGNLLPFKVTDLQDSKACDGAALILLKSVEVVEWPIR